MRTHAKQLARLKRMTRRLYDARTPESVRRDLSLEVSCLRAELGGMTVEALTVASDVS